MASRSGMRARRICPNACKPLATAVVHVANQLGQILLRLRLNDVEIDIIGDDLRSKRAWLGRADDTIAHAEGSQKAISQAISFRR